MFILRLMDGIVQLGGRNADQPLFLDLQCGGQDLVGTLAGDDTAFLAMRNVNSALVFAREIEAML